MSVSAGLRSGLTPLLPVLPILLPLTLHFVLVNFVLVSVWLPLTYFFSHAFFFVVGLWACHDRTEILPALIFMVVVAISGLMDVIQLSIYFYDAQKLNGGGENRYQRTWQFSAGMCIMNLLFKPATIFFASLSVYLRSGGTIAGFGKFGDRDSYSTLHGSDSSPQNAEQQ